MYRKDKFYCYLPIDDGKTSAGGQQGHEKEGKENTLLVDCGRV